MLIDEINAKMTEIKDNLCTLDCLISRLYIENKSLIKEKTCLTEQNKTEYERGRLDGKKELIEKIEKYFELKEKGELNAK